MWCFFEGIFQRKCQNTYIWDKKCVTAHPEIPAVGNYITLTGKADRIDPVFRTLQVGETVVPFEDLVEISGESIMEIDQYLGITED